jgi:putative polyhydroxyalkanoate system protein
VPLGGSAPAAGRQLGSKPERTRASLNHSRTSLLEKRRTAGDIANMTQPIDVDLPHNLGKDEARRRIANNIHKLQEHIPGGAQVQSGWTGDQLNLDVAAMGQSVAATIDVHDQSVHLKVLLPGMLGMFAGVIQAGLQKKGSVLLEDHSK